MRIFTSLLWLLLVIMISPAMKAQGQTVTIRSVEAATGSGSVTTSAVTYATNNFIAVNSSHRQWCVFDLSVIPAGASITSASIIFTTGTSPIANQNSSNRRIYGIAGDQSSAPAATLYNYGSGTPLSGTFAYGTNHNNIATVPLNVDGVNFLQTNAGQDVTLVVQNGQVIISGTIYGGTHDNRPRLEIEYTLVPCTPPADQPTGPVNWSNITITAADGSFTAAPSGPTNYLVVRYPAGATPTHPVDGTAYTAGDPLGTGTVVSAGSGTSFTASGLSVSTTYDFYIYSFNAGSCSPAYNTVNPLISQLTTAACSGVSGVIPVGPNGTYQTLTAALNGISVGIGGPVVLELQSDYTGESLPIVISNNVCVSATNTLTIRPAAGANGLVIGGSNNGPAVFFDGARYVTIDGMPGGSVTGTPISVTPSGSNHAVLLNIRNTHNSGRAIELNNGASYNTIKYCDLQGQNNTGGNVPTDPAGVVYVGPDGAGGNDNNTISYCNVHSTTSNNLPSIGIYSRGPNNNGLHANFNDGNVVSDCNIYDYFLPGNNAGSAGLELNEGVNGWQITGNSFFQTADRTYSGGSGTRYNRGIWVIPNRRSSSVGNGFVITGNYIGGTEPRCGGTAYTLSSLQNHFNGIRLEVKDGSGTVPSVVSGNVIGNISQTTTITSEDPFVGIAWVAPGSIDITDNVIGSDTGTGNIQISAGSGSHSLGMLLASGTSSGSGVVVNARRNVIGSLTLTSNGNNFSGIYINNGGDYLLDSNVLNNIHATDAGTAARFVRGISVPSGNPQLRITNNTITNLTNNGISNGSGSTAVQVAGIRIESNSARVFAIDGNTIHTLSSASRATAGGVDAAVLGIGMSSTLSQEVSVSRNLIHSLVSDATGNGVYMEGIFFIGNNSDNVINRFYGNFIHSFDVTNSSLTAANMRGLEVNGGAARVTNNMVRLGIRPDGTSLTNAIQIWGIARGSTRRHSYFHNSVYIGGAGVGSSTGRHTAAFRNEHNSGADSMINNILVNVRTNTSGGSNHFSVWLNTLTNKVYSHNIYWYGTSSTDNYFASVSSNGNSSISAYTPGVAGWLADDINSIVSDPLFAATDADAATVDLHIATGVASPVEGAGMLISSVTEDFDGENRSALTPVDIGADAGNFVAGSISIINNSPVCPGDTARLEASSQISGTFNWTGPNSFTATGATVEIPGVTAADTGWYYVSVTLGSITVTDSTRVVVNPSVVPSVGVSPNPAGAICAGTSVTFTATPVNGGTTPVYQWRKNGLPVGTNSPTYADNALANNDVITVRLMSNAMCAQPDSGVSSPLTMTVNPVVVPSVSVSPNPAGAICAGTSVTFTATPVNGGTTPVYQWRKNGVPVGTNSPTYADNALANNDVITVRLTSNATCAQPDSGISAPLTMTVNSVTPAVSISATATTICAGTSVTFTAAPANEGTTPVYQWRKNGAVAGTNSVTYTDNSLNDNDVITVRLTSNAACALPDTAISNVLTMTVNPLLTPSVTVGANPDITVCAGTSVTFTATPVNGGATPAYQWRKNGGIVGTNNPTYTDAGLNDGDVLVCHLTSNATCATPDTALSSGTVMNIADYPAATVTASASTDICDGSSVLLTADESNLSYQWNRNGSVVNGATNQSYDVSEAGSYTVTVTRPPGCAATTASPLPVTVLPLPLPIVIVNKDTLTTADHYDHYQWYVNGQLIQGANSFRHIAVQGGVYYVVVTDSNGCTGNSAFYTVEVSKNNVTGQEQVVPVAIYPNPAHDMVYIRAPFAVHVSVHSMDGREVLRRQHADHVPLHELADGMYMITVRNTEGIVIRTEKLIKAMR